MVYALQDGDVHYRPAWVAEYPVSPTRVLLSQGPRRPLRGQVMLTIVFRRLADKSLDSVPCSTSAWTSIGGTIIAAVLVALVVYICAFRKEIRWSAVTMALVALVFAGINTYTQIKFGPGGVDIQRHVLELSERARALSEHLEKLERVLGNTPKPTG